MLFVRILGTVGNPKEPGDMSPLVIKHNNYSQYCIINLKVNET